MEHLEPESTYHIYNRANGSEKLFLSRENYRFFMEKYSLYISPVAETFCYCLLPNHFHFLLRIKPETELRAAFPKIKSLEKLPSKCFSNLFCSYTQAFNKQQRRMGSLFMKNFKRKRVQSASYLMKLVQYIHLNPVEAGLCSSPEEWPHSSYGDIISDKESILAKEELLSWFDDVDNFESMHRI